MRWILIMVLFSGCYSLPEQIAIRAAEQHPICADSADMVDKTLRALDYKGVKICYGVGEPGYPRHAWVEFRIDGETYICDPNAIMGPDEYGFPQCERESGCFVTEESIEYSKIREVPKWAKKDSKMER